MGSTPTLATRQKKSQSGRLAFCFIDRPAILASSRVPTVIVSHGIPQDIPAAGVYTFVDRIEAAFETAKTLAGDKDIYLTGADVAGQFLKGGLIDEISIHMRFRVIE